MHYTSLAMPDDAPVSESSSAELRGELAQARRDAARWEALARQSAASVALQGMRAGAQGTEADRLRREVALVQSSRFWRLTRPLRLAVDVLRGGLSADSPNGQRVRRLGTAMRRDGAAAIASGFRQRLAASRPAAGVPTVPSALDAAVAALLADNAGVTMPPPAQVLAPSVLIVAELTLPQCAKYRVWQKQEHLSRLGRPCRVVDWRFTEACLSAASLATQVIFYRVPAFPPVLHLLDRMHRLGLSVAWEVDDLIFDRDQFLLNRNIDELDPALRDSILSGVDLYRTAMLACDTGIASTPGLAQAMRASGMARVAVVENALDAETLGLAARLRSARSTARDGLRVTYGSGTKTHDADFREAAPALLGLLQAYPDIHLRVVGELTLPPGFQAFGDRVERLPPSPYPRYLQLLAESDISIAPLEATPFNDAKSNIKFLEAAILGVPSVCSPRAHFADIMRHGVNGMLAEGEAAWFAALAALADDAALRARLGRAALDDTLARYDPQAIARTQVAPLLAGTPDLRRPVGLRVLFANIYYAPRSFGGATLVVEEMARRLHDRADTEVHVATGLPAGAADRAVARTHQDGIAVFAIPVADGDVVAEFDNPDAGALFGQVLDSVQPDVVHLHAVQWLSGSLAAACLDRNIPYVITLHDAWWLCARQFMVQGNGRYCFQRAIDLHVCQSCLPGARHLEHRRALLRGALDGAALLLSPSEAHRQLYLANGIAPARIEVAPNGVRLPPRARRARHPGVLRFAYVGGDVEVKGFSIVKRAFEALGRGDWELVLVDNTLKLGFSSVDASDWTVQGRLSIVPAYTQDEIEAFFEGIDVLLFPSQWKESFGLTVREALVRDVWVIATEGGGPAEAITQGRNGTLIPLDGGHEGLRRAVEALLDEPARLAAFVNPARADIIDYQAQADALRATLARVASGHAATNPVTSSKSFQ